MNVLSLRSPRVPVQLAPVPVKRAQSSRGFGEHEVEVEGRCV
jgi:hypothetical protein